MKFELRRMIGLSLAAGLVATSCGGSTDSEPAAPSAEQTTPTTANAADELPGDGDIVYASTDVMCSQEIDGEQLEAQTNCPEGATDYWFLSDNTLVIDTTNFDAEDEIVLRHISTVGARMRWTKAGGMDATSPIGQDDYTEAFAEFVEVEDNFLIIDTNLCLWQPKIDRQESKSPTIYRYESLELSINYEYSPVTIRSNGFILETEDPSLYHSFSTNPRTGRLQVQQGNQAIYDLVHDNSESCDPELDTTGPTYVPGDQAERVGRPQS